MTNRWHVAWSAIAVTRQAKVVIRTALPQASAPSEGNQGRGSNL